MGQTNAQRQQSHRQRHAQHVAELEAAMGQLRASEATREAHVADLERRLEDASAEIEQLREAACKHPSQVVSGGHCHACGADDVW